MKLKNIIYLNSILGENETQKYLQADEYRLSLLIDLLLHTKITTILEQKTLEEFCYKLTFGKYGIVLAELLPVYWKKIKKLTEKDYREIIDKFNYYGYKNEKNYLQIFNIIKLKYPNSKELYDNYKIDILVQKEITSANIEKITVLDFFQNGGTLTDLKNILVMDNIFEFNLNTKITKPDINIDDNFEYEVDMSEIIFLSSTLYTKTKEISSQAKKELLEIYYECLEQGKEIGFEQRILKIKGKPNLYKYLSQKGIVKENKLVINKNSPLKKELVQKR